jgi:hypothetical protein
VALPIIAFLLILLLRKLRSRAPSPTPGIVPSQDLRYEVIIEKELKDLDK